jgi:hypothetical protein
MLMDQEFIKRPSQLEPNLREVLKEKTAEPLFYDESDLIDDEHGFDVDELDADFEYGP